MSSFSEEYKKSPSGLLLVLPAGAGKTKRALEATRGASTSVVGPASLTKNFDKEELKHFGKVTPRSVDTYAGLARGHELDPAENIVLDESHNIRNLNAKATQSLLNQRYKFNKALLMTATPTVNEPLDIASQANMVAGRSIVPTDKKRFYNLFYDDVQVSPPILQRLSGVQPGSIRRLKSPELVRQILDKYTYVEPSEKFESLMPKRKESLVRIPMSEGQTEVYKYIEGTLPRSLRYKIQNNLPPSKAESRNLTAFLSGLRVAANTSSSFSKDNVALSPKLNKITNDIKEGVSSGKKTLVYSNYLDSGIDKIKSQLDADKIPYSSITGSTSKKEREKAVNEYNSNSKKVFLISGAGSEGLNLLGTDNVLLTEPHFNSTRLYQAASRGIRRGDNIDRTVDVKTYLSVLPERKSKLHWLGFKNPKPKGTVDDYLLSMSARKDMENKTFLKALED
jgi:SNF2 family DNA or RNA helicase